MKKIMVFMFLLASTIFLMSCEEEVKVIETLNLSKIEVRLKNENAYEFYEGNELDISNFEATFFHRDGDVEEVEDLEKYDLIYEYNSTPEFDHTDSDDNIFKQDVVFKLGEVKSEPIRIITKRKEVKEVSLISYGNSDYEYGESLDLEGYKLLVNYDGFANEIVNLDYSMFETNMNSLKPSELGVNSYDVFFKGKTTKTPLGLFIIAGSQNLAVEDVEVLSFTKDRIEVNEIDDAVYAFTPKNSNLNFSDLEFTENNVFEGSFFEDYLVFVKLKANKFYQESNVVELSLEFIPEFKKPELLDVTETTVKFKYQTGFNLVLLDDNNQIINNANITIDSNKTYYLVSDLLPNHEYKFAFVNEGLNTIYEENIYGILKTSEALDIITFEENQEYVYKADFINFEFEVLNKYKDLIDVQVTYYQNGERVNPYTAGTYDVLITNNFNSEVLITEMIISKLVINARVLNTNKIYGNEEPFYQAVLDGSLDHLYKFQYEFYREEGEDSNTYLVNAKITNPNYEVIVSPGTLTIEKRNITITANNQQTVYGEAVRSLTYTISEQGFSEELEIILSKANGLVVGNYDITATYNDDNFNVNFKKGIYTITKKTITVKALNQELTYGQDVNKRLFTADGLVYGDKIDVITGYLNFDDYQLNVGTYDITKGSLDAINYDIIFETEILTVNKKTVNVTFTYANKYAGQSNDDINFDIKVTGFAYNDNITSLKFENGSRLTIQTNALIDSPQGTYQIEIDEGYLSENYEFNYEEGTLVVQFVNLWITVEEDKLVSIYDGESKELRLEDIKIEEALNNRYLDIEEYQDFVTFVYNEEMLNANSYEVTIIFSENGVYEAQEERFTYQVLKRDVTIKIDDSTKIYGENDPVFTYSEVDSSDLNHGFVNGDIINLTYKRDIGENEGEYLVKQDTIDNNHNYNVQVNSGNLTIDKRTLTIDYLESNEIIYGEDFNIVVSSSDLAFSDYLNIEYNSYNAGESIGTVDVYSGLDNITNNYLITNPSVYFEIQKRQLKATPKYNYTYTGFEIEVEFSLTNIVNGDLVTYEVNTEIIDAGIYSEIDFQSNNDNYLINLDGQFEVERAKAVIKGADLDSNLLPTFSLDYNDNSLKEMSMDDLLANNEDAFRLYFNDLDVTNEFTLIFNDVTFDLSKGGTTFTTIISFENNDGNYYNIEDSVVVIKFKSVTLGNDTTLYTIEDALKISSNEDIIIKYTTSFSEKIILETVYEYGEVIDINKKIVIPYGYKDGKALVGIKQEKNKPKISPNSYVTLSVSKNVHLNINNGILISAMTSTDGQPNGGFISGTDYGELFIDLGVVIYLKGGSTFESYGFTTGSGTIYALQGSNVIESAVVTHHRGGTIVSGIIPYLFPYDMYSFNNIESKIFFSKGGTYSATTHVDVAGAQSAEIKIIGEESLFSISSNEGYITKESKNGLIIIDVVDTEITMENIKINLASVLEFNSKGLYISIPGIMNINLINSKLTLNASIKLLPGSKLDVDKDSEIIITKENSIHIYSENEYKNGNDVRFVYIPESWLQTFRERPSFDFTSNSKAILNLDGKITVEGSLSGSLESKTGNGEIVLTKTFERYTHVEFFEGLSSIHKSTHTLIDSEGNLILNSGEYIIDENGKFVTDVDFLYNGITETIRQYYGEEWNVPNENYTWYTADGKLFEVKGTFLGINTERELLEADELTITIEFDFGIDSISNEIIEVKSDTILNKEGLPNKEIIGYNFIGWYLDADYTLPMNNEIIVTQAQTLYARYIFGKINFGLEKALKGSTSPTIMDLTVTLTDDNNGLLNGIELVLTGANMENYSEIKVTGEDGKVRFTDVKFTYKTSNPLTSSTITSYFYVSELTTTKNYSIRDSLTVKYGSPIIYSEDEDGELHFEHEPISLSMIKSVEGTSFGTLRLLQDQDGIYYIQIVEEGNSTTMLKEAKLFAVDYLDDGTVLDLFFDIVGNPHTIRERLRPVSFIDSNVNSYLEEIYEKDGITFTVDPTSNTTLTYLEMVFDRTNFNDYAKFMFSVQDKGSVINDPLLPLLSGFNAADNLWWLDQALLNNNQQEMINLFNALKVQVQVWNGVEWITQAQVELGSYLMESFLVNLDLRGINSSQLKVRFVVPTKSGYTFDDVAIDFTNNLDMTIHEMDLVSAILNGDTDVINTMLDPNKYVELPEYKDGVRLGFTAPEKQEGYTRGFGVSMTGYIYVDGLKYKDEMLDDMVSKTFEEIKQMILDSKREDLINDLPLSEEFYYMIVEVGKLSYEEIVYLLYAEIEIG